jgi:pimeloyl-ACP methyl ester carboxylesterase
MHTAIKEHRIHVNGITISYDDKGKGMPIIFIHGFPFNKSAWQPQLEYLQKFYRVIAYDIRGFGNSTLGDEVTSIDLFATDLVQFMDALKIQKAIVCGLSMGGYILMNAVSRFPDRFEAIILSDTQCGADSAEAREKRYKTIEQIEARGIDEFAANYVQNIFTKKTLENRKEIVEEVKNMILSTSPRTISATLKALAERRESCNLLKRVSVPAMILCGKDDTVTPLSQSELLFNTLQGSRMHTIQNAGHMANLEEPEIFNDHIHTFLPGIVS